MQLIDKIYIAGHTGLVGSAILRSLKSTGYQHLITCPHSELDLTRQAQVEDYFNQQKPDYVFLCAAMVGGIQANTQKRADFIYNNLAIQTNVLHAAFQSGVKRLLFMGSSCIYPRNCPQPMQEIHLLSGQLESTNDAYATAKIAGVKMCEAYNAQHGTSFVTVMPTNLYGENDKFDSSAHVLAALLHRIHMAKETGASSVEVWGSGTPFREFLYVDDLAQACVFIMQNEEFNEMVNIGSGQEVTIRALATLICDIIGYSGSLVFDRNKPDGTPRKRLDCRKLEALGWRASTDLKTGIAKTYNWYRQQQFNQSLVA